MPSKIVVDKQKSSRALSNFGKANAEGIAFRVAQITAKDSVINDEKALYEAIKVLILASCERLEKLCAAMIKADEDYTRELGDDDEPRQNRDKITALLSEQMVDLRGLMLGAFGVETLHSLGFSESTPQDPERLVRLCQEVIKTITEKQRDGSFPRPRKGISVDLSAYLPEIEANAQNLDQALGKVSLERRELQVALDQKNTTMDAYDLAFKETAHLFEGLLRFAGRNELADKIRPSTRTPGQLDESPVALQ